MLLKILYDYILGLLYFSKGRGHIYNLNLDWGERFSASLHWVSLCLCLCTCIYVMFMCHKTAPWSQVFLPPLCGFWGSNSCLQPFKARVACGGFSLPKAAFKSFYEAVVSMKNLVLFTKLTVSFVASAFLLFSLHGALLMSQWVP